MKLFFLLVFISQMFIAQTVKNTVGGHQLPFASQNNAIELAVTNSASSSTGSVTVEIDNPPQWIKFQYSRTEITNLKPGEASTARFSFSIDKSAPIDKEQKLLFRISSQAGEQWTKEISIHVAAPDKFELYQNFPNPFNPSTTITYQLPSSSIVSLKVYDILGKEIVSLFEGMQDAGYHQLVWHASNVATGMYLYQLSYLNQKGEKEYHRMKMLLTK